MGEEELYHYPGNGFLSDEQVSRILVNIQLPYSYHQMNTFCLNYCPLHTRWMSRSRADTLDKGLFRVPSSQRPL
jgi:hypothetical protein